MPKCSSRHFGGTWSDSMSYSSALPAQMDKELLKGHTPLGGMTAVHAPSSKHGLRFWVYPKESPCEHVAMGRWGLHIQQAEDQQTLLWEGSGLVHLVPVSWQDISYIPNVAGTPANSSSMDSTRTA